MAKIEKEFTADMEYDGSVRSPMLMAGALPQGSVFRIGGVKLEKVVNFLPLALNPAWTLFLPADGKTIRLETQNAVPQSLGGSAGRKVTLKDNVLNLLQYAKPSEKKLPPLCSTNSSRRRTAGCRSDARPTTGLNFTSTENGSTTLWPTGNRESSYLPTDHVFNFPVKKGINRIAVRVLSGSAGWKFVCGKVPFREKTSRITEVKRGKEWRPVKMDPVQWKHITPRRINQWKRIPGSALDLSQ